MSASRVGIGFARGSALLLFLSGWVSGELADLPPDISSGGDEIREISADGRRSVLTRYLPAETVRAVVLLVLRLMVLV